MHFETYLPTLYPDRHRLQPDHLRKREMAIPAILYSLMMNIVLLIYVAAVRK